MLRLSKGCFHVDVVGEGEVVRRIPEFPCGCGGERRSGEEDS